MKVREAAAIALRKTDPDELISLLSGSNVVKQD